MELTSDGASINGAYHTAVGAQGSYELVGRIDVAGDPSGKGQAIGWTVVWANQYTRNHHSVTTWSGQYQIIDGIEEIETLWLLTTAMPNVSDWASTQINQDTFTRNQPSVETTLRATKKRMPSHPV